MKWKHFILTLPFLLMVITVSFSGGGITGNAIYQNTLGYECEDCNLIVVLVDTLRADHLGTYGYEKDTSPNLDRFAEESIVFKNVVAQTSWTKPAVASILTGLYPQNHKANTRYAKLSEENVLLSEVLKKEGYSTYAFSTNAFIEETNGFDQGFDQFTYFPRDEANGIPYIKADEVNSKVIPFLKNLKNKDKNFIYLHYMDPHMPYNSPITKYAKDNKYIFDTQEQSFEEIVNQVKEEKSAYSLEGDIEIRKQLYKEMKNLYDDEILFFDRELNNIFTALKEEGMFDNSIILVIADHGEELGDHGGLTHGKTLFEEVTHVPWIMYLPKKIHLDMEEQVNQIDMFPTLLSLLGIKGPKNIDGKSVFKEDENIYTFSELDYDGVYLNSVRTQEDKLIQGFEKSGLRNPPLVWVEDSSLFELRLDPNHEPYVIPLELKSFYGEREISVYINGIAAGKTILPPALIGIELTIPKNLIKENKAIIELVSEEPCKKLSELGFEDDRCLSFGFPFIEGTGSVKRENEIDPFYGFFNLKNDSFNLYLTEGTENRINFLAQRLNEHIDSKKDIIKENAKVSETDEQLETLKALGYI